MKKRTIAALAVPLVLLIAAVIVCSWPSNEPVCRGKRVREYLYDLGVGKSGYLMDGFAGFGTNAVPYVRAAFQAKDTWDRRILVQIAGKMPWVKIQVLSADEMHRAALLAYASMVGAATEGKMPFSAVAQFEPEARRFLPDSNNWVTANAQFALWRVDLLKHFPPASGPGPH